MIAITSPQTPPMSGGSVRAQLEPALQPEQVEELPGEDAAEHDREPELHLARDEPDEHRDSDRRRQPDERERPRLPHGRGRPNPAATKTGSPRRAPSARS